VSLTVFLAICVLACDFMIFMFFKRIFREKYRSRARRVGGRQSAAKIGSPKPYLVSSRTTHRGRDTEHKVA
jgi:hypothetical protein